MHGPAARLLGRPHPAQHARWTFHFRSLASSTTLQHALLNLPGWCWAEIQQFALVGSSSSLHSEACNALGASDGVIHSRISQEVVCLRATTNAIICHVHVQTMLVQFAGRSRSSMYTSALLCPLRPLLSVYATSFPLCSASLAPSLADLRRAPTTLAVDLRATSLAPSKRLHLHRISAKVILQTKY